MKKVFKQDDAYLAFTAVCFVALVGNLPATQTALKVAPLDLREWLLAISVPFVAIFWLEVRKIWAR